MDVYAHEKEQIEGIKAWWRENRWYIVAGLIVSAAIVGGWRFWQDYRQQQAAAASVRYEQLLLQAATGDRAALRAGVDKLQNDYAATPYAALATLKLAAEQVAANEFDAATESLRWAMENADDDELVPVARLRLARVLLQQGATDDVQRLLSGVDAGKFQPLFDELRGDLLLATGDRDGARAAYEAALAAMQTDSRPAVGDANLVRMKLENLALPQDVLAVPATEDAAESEAADTAADETAGDNGAAENGAENGAEGNE